MQIRRENQMEVYNDYLFSSPSLKIMNCPTKGTQLHGLGYIEHPVSKLDTLAGVAIKYGVEVADIKKMNGLVTDLQMFALKTLHIPLPGRHPPSPSLSDDFDSERQSTSEQTPTTFTHSALFESFESLKLKSSPHQEVSPTMRELQGYYGLKSTDQKPLSEGFKMAIYHKGSHYLEDGAYREPSSFSNPPLSRHRKSRSMANCFMIENDALINNALAGDAKDANPDKLMEKLVRRRQKSVSDFSSHTPELLMKDNNSSGFSTTAGKGLALRQKANRATTAADSETWLENFIAAPVVTDNSSSLRKSSSTSNLQDSDNNTSSSSPFIWPTSKWNLKPDLQVFSNASITKPIFDGLPKPVTGRRNKAALD